MDQINKFVLAGRFLLLYSLAIAAGGWVTVFVGRLRFGRRLLTLVHGIGRPVESGRACHLTVLVTGRDPGSDHVD